MMTTAMAWLWALFLALALVASSSFMALSLTARRHWIAIPVDKDWVRTLLTG